MFAWLRKLYWNGEIPPKPCDKDLDWPDEEQWVFDWNAWKWKAEAKKGTPVDEWESLVVDDRAVNLDDIPHAIIVDDEPSTQCCGGHCHLVNAPPVTSVVETTPPPVLSVVETDPPPSASQQPIIVSR